MRNLVETNQKRVMELVTAGSCNVTLRNLKFLETPMGMLLQIELLLIFTAFLLLFLVAFGSWRRRYNSSTFRRVIFAAYTISTYILSYALGLMNDAPYRNELFPIWAMFLMLLLGTADSITAYSLEDNEQWRRYNWMINIKLIWVIVMVALYLRHGSKAAITATVFLILILLVKFDERARALMSASQHFLERETKVVADHMIKEHESEGPSCCKADWRTMTGYKFVVRGEDWFSVFQAFLGILKCLGIDMPAARAPYYRWTLQGKTLVTIEKVWGCKGRLLSSGGDHDNSLKDMCLSFALFKLLRLRYAGYTLPEDVHKKTWDLIKNGLLSEEDGYKRAFRVVEDELAFLFDFFYTKYGIMFQVGWWVNKLLEFVYVVIGMYATVSLLKHYKRPYSNCRLATMPNGLSVDVLVTSMMIFLFVIMELMQLLSLLFSEWAKVMYICSYVESDSLHKVWIERMIRAVCGFRLQKPWERKLRQFSLLESYSYKPCMLWNNMFMAVYIEQTRDGQRQSMPIKLTEEIKKVVFDALKSIDDTKLENGQASLRENNVFETLLWACQLETQTQVILVWHIATSFCEHKKPVRSDLSVNSNSPKMRNFLVATSLSKYLAYLVAFAPRLLPDHPYVVEYVFDQAIMEARIFFKGCKRMEEKLDRIKEMGSSEDDNVKRREKKKEDDKVALDQEINKLVRKFHKGSNLEQYLAWINDMGSSEDDKTVIQRGAILGNQLVEHIKDEGTMWKILADFWVELMLFVAPSDDARAHAERLTRGGEFVTHLWALLSHAGIKRHGPTV